MARLSDPVRSEVRRRLAALDAIRTIQEREARRRARELSLVWLVVILLALVAAIGLVAR